MRRVLRVPLPQLSPRCSAAARLLPPVGQQAAGVLTALKQSPLLQDTCAMLVATAGAVALVKAFGKLVREGVIGQVHRLTLPLTQLPRWT